MHKQTDQTERPMRAGHGDKLASRLGRGGNVRVGESPAASTHFQCQHLWSAVGADGYMECLWCRAKQRPAPTTISDHTTPLRSNTEVSGARREEN